MSPLSQIVLVAVGTYIIRISMIVTLGRLSLGPRVVGALRLVAPAVLAALVAQTLFLEQGELRGWSVWYPAAAVAAFVAWRTGSTAWTLVSGFTVVWILNAM